MSTLVVMQGYYRGAKAALKLGEYEEALQLCQRGMALDSEAPELQQLSMEAGRKAKVRHPSHCWVSKHCFSTTSVTTNYWVSRRKALRADH